jgi:hypothetical protein
MTRDTLEEMLARVNATRGYSNRYRLVAAFKRTPGQPRALALVKAVGKTDANVSGWKTPAELAAFMTGFTEGFETCERHVARKRRGVTA